MRLILIRHGETARNASGAVQGRADVPLNDLGTRQAAALAASMRADQVAAVYASPLQRARDTAAPLAAMLNLPVQIEPDLIEMDVGAMEGLTSAAMRAQYAEFLAVWASADGPAMPMPGGESLEAVQQRGWAAVQRIRERHPDETVVAVSHNFVISGIVCRATGVPLSGFRRLRHGIASRTVIDVRAERSVVIHLNDTCHLDHDGLWSGGPWDGPLLRLARGDAER